MVAATPAGSSADVVGRVIAERLSNRLAQPVVVENASNTITAFSSLSRGRPDGYLIGTLSGGVSTLAALNRNLPFDARHGFSMITFITRYPMVVAVRRDSPIKSLRELLEKGSSPGGATYAMNLPGTVHHLVGEWLNVEAKSSMQGVPYRGSPQMLADLLGGRVDAMIDTGTFLIPQIRSGTLRGLAVSSPTRFPLISDVQAMAETLPAIKVFSWIGFAAPAGVPIPIIEKLNREIREILAEPEIVEKLALLGGVPAGTTPEQMQQDINREIDQWNRIIDIKNITRQ
jgi:tripartite-type tricarboxylate transporter receptor subunit TctC